MFFHLDAQLYRATIRSRNGSRILSTTFLLAQLQLQPNVFVIAMLQLQSKVIITFDCNFYNCNYNYILIVVVTCNGNWNYFLNNSVGALVLHSVASNQQILQGILKQ